MPIEFACPICGRNLKVPGSAAGKHVKCPKCMRVIPIPAADGPAAGTPAAQPPARTQTPAAASAADKSIPPTFDETERVPYSTGPPVAEDSKLGPQAILAAELAKAGEITVEGPAAWPVRGVVTIIVLYAVVTLVFKAVAVLNALSAEGVGNYIGLWTQKRIAPLDALNMARDVAMLLVSIVLLYGGVNAFRLRSEGRKSLLVTMGVLVAVVVLYTVSQNVRPFRPPGYNYMWKAKWAGAVPYVLVGGVLFAFLFALEDAFERHAEEEIVDVVELVDRLLREGLRARVSDVHVEPGPEGTVVRYRIDGVLHPVVSYPAELLERIVTRIKVMARMDIAEKMLPQDGGASIAFEDRKVDLRVSTVPSRYGERAVIRLLDRATGLYGMESLGMRAGLSQVLDRIIESPHGVFFCTGPTGSGKTTTLYAALQRVNSAERNIITVEDPVEYHLPGITQLPVTKKKGMTFASGLRSILRQDPDVIMVGEVRDVETAHMVIQAAQTGHLVLSTLHTNDAAGAVARLLDLEVEPFLLSSCLTAVLAQRLVRTICRNCAQPYLPDEEERRVLDLDPKKSLTLYAGRGCEQCMYTGYHGRTGLYQMLVVDEEVRELINNRADAMAVRAHALEKGMHSLRGAAVQKVLAGITTTSELLRVTRGSLI